MIYPLLLLFLYKFIDIGKFLEESINEQIFFDYFSRIEYDKNLDEFFNY